MATVNQPKNLTSLQNDNFPEYPLFIFVALFFLDIGVVFGAFNAFRWGGYFKGALITKPEIHQTHWTSTLLGGVTVLMLGQILFFFSQVSGKRNRLHWLSFGVLGCWLLGIICSYLSVWVDYNTYIGIVRFMVKLAAFLFLVLVVSFFFDPSFRANMKTHPAIYHLLSGTIWFTIAVFWKFDIFSGSLDRLFLFTYIYGFFSLTLFGTLTFVLPILSHQKPRNYGAVRTNLIMLNLAGIFIIYDLYETITYEKDNLFFDIAGPMIWGFAGFFFALYIFDIIYKSGPNTSLIAQIIAILMFEFFVFDTFMKNVFTQWVKYSHVHFLFIGAILLTIIATETRVMVLHYNPETQTFDEIKEEYSNPQLRKLRNIGLVIAILAICGVLLGFTLTLANIKYYAISGVSGLALFVGLLIIEFSMFSQIQSMRKNST